MGRVKKWTGYGRAGQDGQMGVMVREGEMFGGLDDGVDAMMVKRIEKVIVGARY